MSAGGAFGGNRGVRPVPPEKGVFPLDHLHECELEKKDYLACLKSTRFQSEKCRQFSKKYLECRMERNLMAKQDMSELGFRNEDVANPNQPKKNHASLGEKARACALPSGERRAARRPDPAASSRPDPETADAAAVDPTAAVARRNDGAKWEVLIWHDMEDDNGLELSLGLSLGGSSGKSKARDAPLEPKAEPQVEESSSKGGSQTLEAPFVHYYQTNAENQEHSSKQRHSPAAPSFGNFWGQPGSSSAPVVDGSNDPMNHQSPLPRNQSPVNSKFLSEEMNFQKKPNIVAEQPDAISKSSDGGVKIAPISISTDDGSTGENEDVAESEAEGSNSWLVAQREDSAKGTAANRGSDRKRSNDDAAIGYQGKRQPSFSGSESSSGKLPQGNPLSLQASNVVALPYQVPSQVSALPSIASASNFPPVCTVQLRPSTNNGLAVTMGSTSQVTFGYPAVQLPTLETSSSWAFGGPPQAISSFTAKDRVERAGTKQADDGKKPQEAGASSSALVEDDKKSDRGLSLMSSAIRPGIAPNVKFGGSGSYPDLPWVSTTGTGPNGRTISGVTYKFGRSDVKIVCACHGTHMTPDEFIRHATSADAPGQENNTTLQAFPVGNEAASAQN
ncbi:hypothetical protein GUJ93_ZPchr0010g10769 [Zizania palustris]|uniref:Ethylene-responsive binding factor-associated repression domain-containing protein n=1 Tax=Zizania palustris TaxID=103762 RepID=A0A8J5WDY8_ZIZPA|nr:hypothetical protein GUJ93_ZPchr0010g10769 [Zizania palustris]